MNFSFIDGVVFLFFMALLAVCAVFANRLTKSVAHYTVAARKLGLWLGLSTGNAEGMGLVSIAALCQQGYIHGFAYIWLGIIALVLVHIPLFGILGVGIMRFRATRVQTLPQYYEMRYSKSIRIFAGVTLAIGGILNMAIFPVVESQVLIAFLGLPPSFTLFGVSIAMFPCFLFIILALALFFTIVGGMVSVVVTDYIQSVIMFVSLTAATYLIVYKVGISAIKAGLETNLGDAGFNPLSTDSIGAVFLIVVLLSSVVNRLAFSPTLQKISSAKDHKVVKQMYLLSNIFVHGRYMMLILWGVAALALLGADTPAGQETETYQRIVGAIMLGKLMPPVLMGLILAGFIFASISTNDSYLLSWSSIIANDVICTVSKKTLTGKEHIRLLRFVSTGVAIFIFCFGLWYDPKESIIQYMYLTGAIFGGCGLLTWFGLYWRRATNAGAWVCLMLALFIPTGWMLFQQSTDYLTNRPDLAKYINNDTVSLFAMIFPAIVFVIISLFTRKSGGFVDYGKQLKQMKAAEDRARSNQTEATGA